jgi:ABC-2 type transport system ATP-binding protein
MEDTMSLQTAIQINHLTKSFGSNQVITDCSMRVEQGTVYGFLGANGAGKTTIFKLLTGLITPDSGSIEILGFNMQKDRDNLLSKIGSLIEIPIFYEHLSARKNLEIHLAYMGGAGISSEHALQLVGLSDIKEKNVSVFSLGMRQRLGIARALIHQPQVLILDEPLNGLDPIGIKDMRELFLNLTQQNGMTILFSSHILSEIEHVANKVGVIKDGRILCESNMPQIKAKYKSGLEDYFINLMRGEKPL